MNKIITTTPVTHVLMVMCLVTGAQAVSAGFEAECRQEAEDYEIMPELREEYITGCIDSRGGVSISDSAEEDYVPPSESDDEIYTEVGNQIPTE